jgi:hypothetical protein
VLYLPGLKNNMLSILVIEDRGFTIMFNKGQVLICPEGASLDTRVNIGFRYSNLYRLMRQIVLALVHDNDNMCELWHKALPILREIVTSLPYF